MKESAVEATAVLQLCSKWNKVCVSSFHGWVYRSLQQTYKYMHRQSIVNLFTETVELGVLVPYPEEGNEARDQRLPSVLKNKERTLKKMNEDISTQWSFSVKYHIFSTARITRWSSVTYSGKVLQWVEEKVKRKDSMEPNVCKKHPLRLCTRKEKHHRVHRLDSSSCVRKDGFFTSQIPSGYQTLASFLSLSVNIHPNKPEVPPYPFCVSAPNPIKHVRL